MSKDKELSAKQYPLLSDYFNDFVGFLETNKEFFRFEINEFSYIIDFVDDFISGIKEDFKLEGDALVKEQEHPLTQNNIEELAKRVFEGNIQFVRNKESIGLSKTEYIKEKYLVEINKRVLADKELYWLTEEQKKTISEIACELFDKKFDRNTYVGFAIAGYGDKEVFPSLVHAHLCGFIDGKVRYYIQQRATIDERHSASVVPLAQTDVMETFLFGINDQFLEYLANEIPTQISEKIKSTDNCLYAEGKKDEVLKQLIGITGNVLQHVQETAVKNYMGPIFESVSTLPIEELGLLAESMINITSIRRKVALDRYIGTVGGPIDVSIITKGDGFIWLKRKHYFEKKYNPQFFYSHYRETVLEEGHEDER